MVTINWLDAGFLVLMVIALVNAIKTASSNKWGYWYMLISLALGFGMYALALYAPEFVKIGFAIGITASGIYDVYQKK
jgi:uncharacterized membrane-anchored protein